MRSPTLTWQQASDNLAACSCASKSRLYIRPWKRGKLSSYRVNIWVRYIHALRHSFTHIHTHTCAEMHKRTLRCDCVLVSIIGAVKGLSKCRWFVSCEDLLQWFLAVLRVKGQYALPLVFVYSGSLEVGEVMPTGRNAISRNRCPFFYTLVSYFCLWLQLWSWTLGITKRLLYRAFSHRYGKQMFRNCPAVSYGLTACHSELCILLITHLKHKA